MKKKKEKSLNYGYYEYMLIALLITIIIFLLVYTVRSIILPLVEYSYHSYNMALLSYEMDCKIIPSVITMCNYTTNDLTNLAGFGLAGFYDPETDQIKVLSEEGPEIIYAHELCHKKQNQEGRMHSCVNKLGVIFDEFECYFKTEWMDDR